MAEKGMIPALNQWFNRKKNHNPFKPVAAFRVRNLTKNFIFGIYKL
jgi:hypothetical protein